jgi:hypothetical protein
VGLTAELDFPKQSLSPEQESNHDFCVVQPDRAIMVRPTMFKTKVQNTNYNLASALTTAAQVLL